MRFLSHWFSYTMGLAATEAKIPVKDTLSDEVDGDEPDVFYECNDGGYVDVSDVYVHERRSDDFLYGDTYFEDSIRHVATNFYKHLEDGPCPEEEHESGDGCINRSKEFKSLMTLK